MFFRYIHFISEPAKKMIAKLFFNELNAFSFGSNSILREDHCNNLHQWLASVRLTCFWFRLEFSYEQEKQLVFVQVFLKLNKVSIDCSLFVFSFCGKLLQGTQQQCYNKELPFHLKWSFTGQSFWNYFSHSSGIKKEKWLKYV